MKKLVLIAIIGLISCSSFSQSNLFYKVGDTLYYSNNRVTLLKTNTFVIIKETNVARNSNSFKVEKFLMNTKTDLYVLDSKFTTNGLQKLISNGIYTSYHKNGEKSTQGPTVNGRIGDGVWTYWYENGEKRSEEKLSKETFFSDKKVSLTINFWDENGVQTVENGNGFAQYVSIGDGFVHKGGYKDGLKTSVWTAFDGEIKIYEETYKKGKILSGTSWNTKKESFNYKEVFTKAFYKREGNGNVRKFVSRKFKSNSYGTRGSVFVTFLVSKFGDVSDVNIVRGISPEYNSEVKSILSTMTGWTPAKKRGQIMESTYSLSLNFKD